MTEHATEAFRGAVQETMYGAIARKIRTRVSEALARSARGKKRWSFELLQNACDAWHSPDDGVITATFKITKREAHVEVMYEHDAPGFKPHELTNLVFGGSSKGFEEETTTGRFGTGFLATHVLGPVVVVEGSLLTPNGNERFSLRLDRSGNDQQLQENLLLCEETLRTATPQLDHEATRSRFTYDCDDASVIDEGLVMLRASLPQIFATRPMLRKVIIDVDGSIEEWTADAPEVIQADLGCAVSRVQTKCSAAEGAVDAIIFEPSSESEQRLIVTAAVDEDGTRTFLPRPTVVPSLFVRFPVLWQSPWTFPAVIDATLAVQQERDSIQLEEHNFESLAAALALLPAAMQFAVASQWRMSEELARLAVVTVSDVDAETQGWWRSTMLDVVSAIANTQIVPTANGETHCASGSPCADFLLGALDAGASSAETGEVDFDALWELACSTNTMLPVQKDVARRWSEIALGWRDLGLELDLVSLGRLGQVARDNIEGEKLLAHLPVTIDHIDWIAEYLRLVGRAWRVRGSVSKSDVDGLLPDQNGNLRDANELVRDEGIEEELKDVASALGIEFRTRLLSVALTSHTDNGSGDLAFTLTESLPKSLTKDDALEECVKKIVAGFTAKKNDVDHDDLVWPSMSLLAYVWRTRGEAGRSFAARIPLCTRDGQLTSSSELLLPVPAWPEAARPFCGAFPRRRVLGDVYETHDFGGFVLTAALASWGLLTTDLIVTSTAEVKDDRLRCLALPGEPTKDCTLKGVELSQISAFSSALQREDGSGRKLLGFILAYVVSADASWRTLSTVNAKRNTDTQSVRIRGALWLADLLRASWIKDTATGERVKPTRETLTPLLNGAWLANNPAAAEFLQSVFGFDPLDIKLLAAAPNEAERRALKEQLARVIDVGATAEGIAKMVEHAEAAKEASARAKLFRALGLAVQGAVQAALDEDERLKVKVVDHGYDLLVEGDVSEKQLAP